MKNFSAYIEDLAVSALPKDVRATVEKLITVKKDTRLVQYGMTVKELVPKADPHNLKTARGHVRKLSTKRCMDEVQKRLGEKFVLLLNDRIIDGHHFLAKAERGRATNSLMVLDLTPARFQLTRRLAATVELSRDPYRKDGGYRNAAVGTGALAAGGGVAYAGWRAGQAARQVGAAANDARKLTRSARTITTGVAQTGNKIIRAGTFIKRQLGKLARVRLSGRLAATVDFAEKKKERKGLHPAAGAALSGAASGAILGALPGLRRGVGLGKVLKSVAATAGASAGIVGGGTLIGTKIIGKPGKDEGAAYTKRAAVGGGIAGAAAGVAGGLLASRTRAGRRMLVSAAKTWRPARWARKSGTAGTAAIGGVAGGAVGVAQGADEGQQVDSIRNLRKDMKKNQRFAALPSRLRATIEFSRQPIGYEAGIPLTGKVNRDRWVKKLRDEDLNRRDANILRTGLVGAAVGAAVGRKGKLSLLKRAAIGAGAGAASVIGVRAATDKTRDAYGERSRGGKQVEVAPAAAGLGALAVLGARRIKRALPRRFEATLAAIEFGRRDQPRFVDTKQYADPLRAYGSNAPLVDAAGNATRLSQSQIVNAAWRGGHQIRKTVRRGSNLIHDVADVATGRPKTNGRKREWDKEYFRNSVITAASAAGLLGHAVARRKLPGYRARTDAVEQAVKKKVQKIRGRIDGGLGLSAGGGGEIFFSRVEATLLFDAMAAQRGWDVRDPRGKSARVFAPGSQRRQRRTAEWYEKKDAQRSILGTLAAAGTVAGLAGGVIIGRKLATPKRVIPAVKSHQKPGYRSKKVAVVSRRTFRRAADEMG